MIHILPATDRTASGLRHGVRVEPQPPPLSMLLTTLLNDLATLSQLVLLVFDDYQVIATPALHEALTFVLERLPPTLRLVIASRDDPPLPLARLRARAGHGAAGG